MIFRSTMRVPALLNVASRTVVSLRTKYTLPDLPYDYNALEPAISADIMKLHHTKHHATYVNNLNTVEAQLSEALSKKDVSEIIRLEPIVKFNGGGHLNHSIFWKNLCPTGGGDPTGPLLDKINESFKSVDSFRAQMSQAAAAVQGSGWAWLGFCKQRHKLLIKTTQNQDPLEATTNLVPLLGIDVWEHAYYLQYKNVRPDYLKAIWKVVNWKDVSERLEQAKSENSGNK